MNWGEWEGGRKKGARGDYNGCCVECIGEGFYSEQEGEGPTEERHSIRLQMNMNGVPAAGSAKLRTLWLLFLACPKKDRGRGSVCWGGGREGLYIFNCEVVKEKPLLLSDSSRGKEEAVGWDFVSTHSIIGGNCMSVHVEEGTQFGHNFCSKHNGNSSPRVNFHYKTCHMHTEGSRPLCNK